MTDKLRDHSSQRARSAAAFMLGLFLMIFLGSLAAESADAAPLRGFSSGFASCPDRRLGATGPCVRRLQKRLDKDHISPYLQVNGRFDKRTKRAVENFQRKKGLRHDGIAGPQTFRVLEGTRQVPRAGTQGSSRDSSILRLLESFLAGTWRHTGAALLSFGGIVVILLAAAALFGVKSVHITYSRKRVDCDVVRFPPQRIVDTQAEVIRQYIELQSQYPQQLSPPGDYIRSIGQGG